jgi:UDP-N-acetylglucosamine transferase subunit ALG13
MKLFVTVGTQYPFDRLVRTIDQWAGRRDDMEIFAQTGPTEYRPRNMRFAAFIDAEECSRQVEQADAVLAHAGMGSIITAMQSGKLIVVMPRRADLGEHRNDHQMATARKLLAQGKVIVAFDESHLLEKLNQLDQLSSHHRACGEPSPRLLATLREFVTTGKHRAGQPARREEFGEAVSAGMPPQEMEIAFDQAVHG